VAQIATSIGYHKLELSKPTSYKALGGPDWLAEMSETGILARNEHLR